ncbi:MAG: tetratricopeptide repeat protein [Caldilineaceae bacterium]
MGPLLGQLLAVRFGTSWDERLQYVDPNQLHQRTFAAMQTLIGALARVQPLVLVFEDLHWADALSVDLITALLEKLATLPLLLLCVYRPEAAQADNRLANVALHRCPERFTELRVRELTPQQSRQLVASLLAIEALPTGLREIILTKAQGNPFFLEEIVRVLIDNGQIYRVGATWQASATLDNFTVPDTLENIILRRLDQLPTAMRQVLQMAAVLGRLFRPALLSRMMLPLPDLESLLRVLSEKNFIYLERTLPEAEYSFHHVLVRDAIYQALPQSQRLVLHRHAGEALESRYATHLTPYIEELAYHYDQADVGAKAIPYLLQAGEKARRTYLNPEAAAYFKRALARLDAQPVTPQTQSWRLTALTGLGRLYQVMSEYDAAEHYLREAIALGPQVALPVAERVRLYYWLGDLLLNWQPRPQAALQLALDGLGLLGDDQTSAEAAMMAAVQAWSYCLLNNMPQFSAIGFRLATFLADAPYAQELRPAYGVVATTYLNNKEITTALHWIDHARRKAAQYQDLHWLAESAYPFTRVFAGQPLAEIMAGQVESLRLFRLIGDRKRVNWNDIETGFASLLYGMLTQAQAALERSLPEVHQINQENLPSVHRLLGEVYHAQGRWTEALTTFQQALDYYRHDSCHPAEALVALAYTHLHAGQCTTAIDAFNEALTAMEGPGFQIAWGHYPTLTRSLFANALCGLEEALADPAAFQAFCAAFRAARPALVDSPFTHWYLMPAQPSLITASNTTVTPFATGVGAPWQWRDPVGNATVCTTTGLQIETPNVRELWDAFLTAPCLLQPVAGDWIAQVVCQRPRPDRPAIGGLLLWQDKWHFLRLDWGTRGQAEVALQGCVNRQEVVIGRGRLPGEQIYLRLERTGDLMQGFCSRDGATWFSVGKVEFAVTAPVQIGLFTGSYIERLIEPGAFAEGTAIRFECFVLGKPP